jgi:predicted ATP-binding protein involved in virulence
MMTITDPEQVEIIVAEHCPFITVLLVVVAPRIRLINELCYEDGLAGVR